MTEFNKHGCSKSNSYGFAEGKPCVILSLNRLIGWYPLNFEAEEIPKEIASRYEPGSIAFNCNGMVSYFIKDYNKGLAQS